MIRMRRRRAHRDWTAATLGCAAIALLTLAAAFLMHVHSSQMQTLRAQAAQTRAQLMAQSIGQRLADATAAGIPLQQLVGVVPFLARWQAQHPDIAAIAIDDAQGRLLWHSPAGDTPSREGTSTGHAEVAPAGTLQARVRLQLRHADAQDPVRMVGQLAPAVLLVSVLAWIGARFACAQGPWLRNHGVRVTARWAIRGDYRRLLFLPQHKSFDLRVQEIAQAMRQVHERMARMRLLTGSLRRTEPQQMRRDYLDQVLQQAEGQDRFAHTEPDSVRLVAVQSQSLWMALLLSMGAFGPLALTLRLMMHAADHPGPWQHALPGACMAVLLLTAVAGWQLGTRLRIAMVSVLILGLVALAMPLFALLLGSELHPGVIAAWNGVFVGVALAACTRVQTHPDRHPRFAHSQPHRPGAALLAWWGAQITLGPALGYYNLTTLPPAWAPALLLVPMGCGLWYAVHWGWDVAQSPWRVRMAAVAGAPLAGPAAPGWMLGIATGLVAGPVLLTMVTPDSAALLQPCALGIGLALGWAFGLRQAGLRRAGPGWRVTALAAALLQLLVASAPALPATWHPDWLQMVSGTVFILVGMLLAQRLAEAAKAPQETVSQRLLLGGALGAGLSAMAGAAGLLDGLPLLVLLLLRPLRVARAKGHDVA